MKTEFILCICHCLELLIWVMRKSGAHTPYFASLSFPTWKVLLNDSLEHNLFWEFEKLIDPQLVKTFPAFLTPVRCQKCREHLPLVCFQNHINPCHTLLSCLLKIHFNIICPIYTSAFQLVNFESDKFLAPWSSAGWNMCVYLFAYFSLVWRIQIYYCFVGRLLSQMLCMRRKGRSHCCSVTRNIVAVVSAYEHITLRGLLPFR